MFTVMINELRDHEGLKKGVFGFCLDDISPPARMVYIATYGFVGVNQVALKITDVNPKSQTLPPGSTTAELTITWETESDAETTEQIALFLHLDGEPLLQGTTGPVNVSQSPSKVAFTNVGAGKYVVYAIKNSTFRPIGVSPDIEIKAQDPLGSTPLPPVTDPRNDDPWQTSTTTTGTPPTIVTPTTTQTTSSMTAKMTDIEQADTEISTTGSSGTVTPTPPTILR
ncbi:hypothetical protein VNI00_015097 [Paramarasmius palmivorus]|uniref:Uncharacterized protein n=1 Tax=Paramarasmius palmivorus TaxID=297713 RepID=A0AAW0BNV8_9AGAR